MNISLSQQVSATYARNHFKKVNEKAVKEGMCIIVCKSKPATVLIPMDEYLRLKNARQIEQAKHKKTVKKMTLEELRKDSFFEKYAGCMQDEYPGMTALEWQHNWHKYVD